MRLHHIALPLPLILIACATPQEACISAVTRDARVLTALVEETRANLSRGYALEERQEVATIRTSCTGRNPDGSRFSFPCNETVTRTRLVPVAIDLDAERAKLSSLEERLNQEQQGLAAAVQQCVARYPES